MNKIFYIDLLKAFAATWAKNQTAAKLRKFAASPDPDIHISWRLVRWGANVWVKLPADDVPKTWKRLAKVTVSGEQFDLWWEQWKP